MKTGKRNRELLRRGLRLAAVLLATTVSFVACGDSKNPVVSTGDELLAEPAAKKGGAAAANASGGGATTGGSGSETAYSSDAGSGVFAGYNEADCPDYGIAEYALWAGKTNNAGSVTITSDDENLYVTYNTNGTADLKEVHVYVWNALGDIPDKRPAPGRAPYKAENIYADSYTVVIPQRTVCGETLYVSTHAALVADATDGDDDDDGTGASNDGETAYAGGSNTPDGFENGKGAWWGYVTYTVDCYYDISGTVYLDADDSGDLESGETGFEGIEVVLKDADGNVVATTTTDENGAYLFEHLPKGGIYNVEVVEGPADHIANEQANEAYTLNNCVEEVDFGYVPVDPCDLDPQAPGCGGGGDDSGHETAYAVGNVEFCGNDTNNKWGWVNEIEVVAGQSGSVTQPIYAGAGQCDITKGTLIGTLTIDWSASSSEVTVTVTHQIDSPYHIDTTHTYIGFDVPEKIEANGLFTVVNDNDQVTSDSAEVTLSFTPEELAADNTIHVIAHMESGGF